MTLAVLARLERRLTESAAADARRLIRTARLAPVRTMRVFAEEELVVPDGPHAGLRFRADRQPFGPAWFDAVDSGLYNRFVITAGAQSGKTLLGSTIPTLYYLFEHGETVVYGVPDQGMADDKWRQNLLPLIEASRFREYLPAAGEGSRGGRVERKVTFLNGAVLRFMSGGARDRGRAGFTARIVVVTEVDGLAVRGEESDETDKLSQMEARARSYGDQAIIFLESTPTTPQGRIWQAFESGTATRLSMKCPACGSWIILDREHLCGWQEANTASQARDLARFRCPSCEASIDETMRRRMHTVALAVDAGQQVEGDGVISGEPRRGRSFSLNWSAWDNAFASIAQLGEEEWVAAREADPDHAGRRMAQLVWGRPYVPPDEVAIGFSVAAISRRVHAAWTRGIVPPGTELISAGIDVGRRRLHWVLIAWLTGATGHIIDYAVHEVLSDQLGEEVAILTALREVRDIFDEGFPDGMGARHVPLQVWIDAGYVQDAVLDLCVEAGRGAQISAHTYRPSLGRAATQRGALPTRHNRGRSSSTRRVGPGYELRSVEGKRVWFAEVNVDHWKSWLMRRLTCPVDAQGALTLFDAPPSEHLTLARHWTAEKPREEYHPRLGAITRWGVADGKTRLPHNHFFDAAVLACAAGAACGVSPLDTEGSRLVTRKRQNSPWAIYRKRPGNEAWQPRPWKE